MSAADVILFHFDYVDPASFLLERRLWRLLGGRESLLVLEPFETCLPPDPPPDPEDPGHRPFHDTMEAAAAVEGVKLARSWLVPWTRKAHELAFHAAEHGCFRKVHDALFHAYLLEGRDIGRVDILVDVAAEAGLDRMEAKAVLDVDRYSADVETARNRALSAGVSSVPSLTWKGETLVGLPDEARLREFLAR